MLAATIAIALVGLLALPAYTTNYNDRYYIPGYTPANIGYHASDRHFPQARMEPELLMVEADHDLRNPADMIVLDKVAKNVFHIPGIARVQDITRPLGTPIDHSSVPFQISLQAANEVENLQYLHDVVSNLTKVSDQLLVAINITDRLADLTINSPASHTIWTARPTRSSRIPMTCATTSPTSTTSSGRCATTSTGNRTASTSRSAGRCGRCSMRLDGIDTLQLTSIGNDHHRHATNSIRSCRKRLDALLPQLTATLRTVRALSMTATSTMSLD